MVIRTGHNQLSQDDMDNMTDAEIADYLGVAEAVQEDAEWCCDCFPRLLEQIKELKAVVADLETVVDEIPNMGALFGAVQELQEQYDAPANTFTHYIGGSRI